MPSEVLAMMRYLVIGSAGLALLCGIQTYRIDRLKNELTLARQDYATLRAEHDAYKEFALSDAQAASDQCEARVMGARLSARRIETIVEREVARDPSGCPIRSISSASELRQALQPDAPAS